MGSKIAGLLLAVLIIGFIILEIFGAIAGVHTFLFGESKEEREAREHQMVEAAYEDGYKDGFSDWEFVSEKVRSSAKEAIIIQKT